MKYVKREEFACPCDACGQSNRVKPQLVERLNYCREKAGVPFKINSGYRCEVHNALIGGSPNSTHMLGEAADIAVPNSQARHAILRSLILGGFNRIGIYKTFIHCDLSTSHSQNVVWYG